MISESERTGQEDLTDVEAVTSELMEGFSDETLGKYKETKMSPSFTQLHSYGAIIKM